MTRGNWKGEGEALWIRIPYQVYWGLRPWIYLKKDFALYGIDWDIIYADMLNSCID